LLLEEYRDLGQPDNCRVYSKTHPNGSYSYFFSPGAAEAFKVFLNFWEGSEVPEPTDIDDMVIVI
jgi:hypothetical protein